jgi:hypothetical protein
MGTLEGKRKTFGSRCDDRATPESASKRLFFREKISGKKTLGNGDGLNEPGAGGLAPWFRVDSGSSAGRFEVRRDGPRALVVKAVF